MIDALRAAGEDLAAMAALAVAPFGSEGVGDAPVETETFGDDRFGGAVGVLEEAAADMTGLVCGIIYSKPGKSSES